MECHTTYKIHYFWYLNKSWDILPCTYTHGVHFNKLFILLNHNFSGFFFPKVKKFDLSRKDIMSALQSIWFLWNSIVLIHLLHDLIQAKQLNYQQITWTVWLNMNCQAFWFVFAANCNRESKRVYKVQTSTCPWLDNVG